MFRPVQKVLTLILLATVASSCGFTRNKTDSSGDVDTSGVDPTFLDANHNPVVPPGKTPGYNTVKALIFTPYCASCHMNGKSNGNVSLDTYASAKAALDQIYDAVVVSHSMPQGGEMSPAGQAFLTAWYQAGGPENDLGTSAPAQACTPAAGVDASYYDAHCNVTMPQDRYPGYNTVKALVFQNRCFGCHFAGNPKYKDDPGFPIFDTFAAATEPQMLDAIIKATLKGKYMPIGGTLSNTEQGLISAWYQGGAQENDATRSSVANPRPAPTPEPIRPPVNVPSNTVVLEPGSTPGYETVYALVFHPYCIQCHNVNHDAGGVRFDSYAEATQQTPSPDDPTDSVPKDIQYLVFTKKAMPPKSAPNGPIPPELLPVLQAWLDNGTPAQDIVSANASTTPAPASSPSPTSH